MTTFLALLRGINVGKAKRISMEKLRALFLECGYTQVSTLLNSGNVVFEAGADAPDELATNIAQAIAAAFAIEVPVVVKSAAELEAIVAENPLAADAPDHAKLLIAFVQDPKALAGLAPLRALVVEPERFFVGKHAAYLYCVSGILNSKAGSALLGKPGKGATTRNWDTVLRLRALMKNQPASAALTASSTLK